MRLLRQGPCNRHENTLRTNNTGGRLPSSEPNKHASMSTCEQLELGVLTMKSYGPPPVVLHL